ncbi:MAG: alpha/beta hydrolase [Actinomycetia bacterium]|nr:alpha/beta hydrolase [Actinomycetes bacterium]
MPGHLPHQVGTAAVEVSGRRPLRVRVWFPRSGPAGEPSPGRCPAIAFGPGYLAPVGAYAATLSHLAGHGFVVVGADTERGPAPRHAALADDLNRALEWLCSGATGVPLLRDVADPDRLGLLGHSMGGGCAVLAAAASPVVRSLSTLAAARTRPSSVDAAGRLAVPTQLVAAERDAMTPVGRHQRPMFEAVPSGIPAQLRIVRGGSHGGFVDALGPLGGRPFSRPRLPRADQLALVRDVLVAWFGLTLAGRGELYDEVWGSTARDRTDLTLETRSAPPGPASVSR